MVGATGFEPATSWSQTRRSTRLSYTPFHERQTVGEATAVSMTVSIGAHPISRAVSARAFVPRRHRFGPTTRMIFRLRHLLVLLACAPFGPALLATPTDASAPL